MEEVALIIAAATDAFFATGYVWWGTAVMVTASSLYVSGNVTIASVAVFCAVGSFLGSMASFLIGRAAGTTEFVSRFLERPIVRSVSIRLRKNESLAIAVLTGKFFGVLRPAYALLLGSNRVDFFSYLIWEATASIVWSLFWSTILYFGVDTISELIRLLF